MSIEYRDLKRSFLYRIFCEEVSKYCQGLTQDYYMRGSDSASTPRWQKSKENCIATILLCYLIIIYLSNGISGLGLKMSIIKKYLICKDNNNILK